MNRKQKIEYLKSHFRYFTMNSWNRSTSYACKVKIYDFVSRDLQDKAFEIMEQGIVYLSINTMLDDWAREYDYKWQIGFNGRSDGYLVLYQGGKHENGGLYSRLGLGTDQDEDFAEWDSASLTERVKLVQSFDKICQECKDEFLYYCNNYKVDKVIKVLEEVQS